MKRLKHKNVIFSTSITAIFLFVFMIIKGMEPFGTSTLVNFDCASQVYPLLCTLHDKLRTGESFFYSWEGGLGDGFLPTFFYYLASPINLFVVFVDKSDIRSFINVSIFIRMTLSAMTMAMYLEKKVDGVAVSSDENEKSEIDSDKDFKALYIVPISIAYALSAFVFGYYHESMWLDSYMIFPLIMLGYEKLTRDRKPLLYILCLVYSSICSFYMTFMIGGFLVLWILIDRHYSLKEFGNRFLMFSISSALAIGMTFMSLWVSYLGVMKTHVENEPEIVHKWFGNIFNIIKYQFPMSTPINVSYDNNCANLYCGLFAVALFFVYAFTSRIKIADRIKRILLIFFILISMNEAILNFVWHGFHYQLCIPNRFSFLMIFLLLLSAFEALQNIDNIIMACIGLVIAECFPMVSYFFEDFDSLIDTKMVLVVSIILILVYAVFVILQIMTHKRVVYIVFSLVMLSEILVNGLNCLSYNLSDAGRYDGVVASTEVLMKDNYIEDSTPFYRSKLLGTVLNNSSYILGQYGISTFNSMINSNLLRFSSNYGVFRTDVSVDENGGYEPLDDILGVKYLYSVKEKYVSENGYENVGMLGDVECYRNNNALSLGYAVNKDIDNISPDDFEILDNVNILATALSGCGDLLIEEFPEYEISGEGYGIQTSDERYFYAQLVPNQTSENPYVRIGFDVKTAGRYNMYMYYSDYGIISVYVNNEIRRYEYTSFNGILNIGNLSEGDRVDVIVQSENRMADGYALVDIPFLQLRFARINEQEYESFINELKQNQMNIDEISGGHIKATVTILDGKKLFTTIPYDDGWQVYDNGKEVEVVKTADTFVGLNLSPGDHELEFKFIPPGLYIGLVVTLISWILFAGFTLYVNHSDKSRKKILVK